MNRREHPRVAVNFPVSFSHDSKGGDGLAHNLSVGGCLVESDVSIQHASYLELELCLPDAAPPLKVESAAVRWTQGRAFGVEFLYMRPREYDRLDGFLATMKQQPSSSDAPTHPA